MSSAAVAGAGGARAMFQVGASSTKGRKKKEHFVGSISKTWATKEMGEQTRNAYNCMWEGKKRTKHA